MPSPAEASPSTMTRAAPSPAPEDTPSPKGEASGFCKSDCITAPQTARAAPVRKASSTRGRRMSSTMTLKFAGICSGRDRPKRRSARMARISADGTYTLPIPTPKSRVRSAASRRIPIFVPVSIPMLNLITVFFLIPFRSAPDKVPAPSVPPQSQCYGPAGTTPYCQYNKLPYPAQQTHLPSPLFREFPPQDHPCNSHS